MQRIRSLAKLKKAPIARHKTQMILTIKKSSKNIFFSKKNNNDHINSAKGQINSPKKINRRSFFYENKNDEKSDNISSSDVRSSITNSINDEQNKEKENENEKLIEENKINSNDSNKSNEIFPSDSSFVNSDPEEIRSIFGQVDLKNENQSNTTNFFENSIKSSQLKTEEINESDLDPNIKEVLLLFVLNQQYYELLIQERAKKAFSFGIKKKNK